MVDERGDPEVGDFGDQFWPLLKEWLTEFVVFLFYFEDLLTGLLVQPERKKLQTKLRASLMIDRTKRYAEQEENICSAVFGRL